MQDELFQRQWIHSHDRFSHDVDAGLAKLRRVLTALGASCRASLRRKADSTGRAVVIGLFAGAALGSAVLANTAVETHVQDAASDVAPVRIASTRLVLA